MTSNAYNRFALPTPEQMAQIDRCASEHVPVATLMENAGRAVARLVLQRYRPCRVLVLCGPGNNGGDGLVAARHLMQAGWGVSVALLQPEANHGADYRHVLIQWRGPCVAFSVEEVRRSALVIDAVFGAGLNRDVDESLAAVLAAARRLVCVDIPTGVDGGTGQVRGHAPIAEHTITFFRPKPGHFLLPGRQHAGQLHVADILIPESVLERVEVDVYHNQPGLWRVPGMDEADHKYTRGTAMICGGETMTGAARLSAAAARHAGAGLVGIAVRTRRGADIYRSASSAGVIVYNGNLSSILKDRRLRVWVCGPGLTPDEAAYFLPPLLACGCAVVADAGVLAWACGGLERLSGVAVITPHEAEFTRLFGEIGPDRVEAARRAACKVGCVVVLKGATTVVAAPDGRVALNTHASAALASAGTGDVLSGVIAALMAAGMPVWDACCAAVWMHGESALMVGDWLVAEDILPLLAHARRNVLIRQG